MPIVSTIRCWKRSLRGQQLGRSDASPKDKLFHRGPRQFTKRMVYRVYRSAATDDIIYVPGVRFVVGDIVVLRCVVKHEKSLNQDRKSMFDITGRQTSSVDDIREGKSAMDEEDLDESLSS